MTIQMREVQYEYDFYVCDLIMAGVASRNDKDKICIVVMEQQQKEVIPLAISIDDAITLREMLSRAIVSAGMMEKEKKC